MVVHRVNLAFAGLVLAGLAAAAPVRGAAVRDLPGFQANTLPANDDSSTAAVTLPFSPNFFGTTYSAVYVNNNGNVTFTGAEPTFTPFPLSVGSSIPIIAAFFADVDTRGTGSGLATYGSGTVDGHTAFGVEYPAVGYFRSHADKLNTFELVLIDRSDTGVGNFDIEFNYNRVQFETGDASRGVNGLGGFSARVGYSTGSASPNPMAFELPGSAVNGAFLDGGPNALIANSLNSNIAGRYIFEARNGTVSTPEPASLVLLGLGGVGAVGVLRRRRRPA